MKNGRNHCSTPWALFHWADRRWGPFDVDVAAEEWNRKCAKFFSKEENGLEKEWRGRIWCNPPWSRCEAWVRKAVFEVIVAKNAELVTMLLPLRTGTHWWGDLVDRYASEVKKIRGRVRFDPPPGEKRGSGGFESCSFVVFEPPLCASMFGGEGDAGKDFVENIRGSPRAA